MVIRSTRQATSGARAGHPDEIIAAMGRASGVFSDPIEQRARTAVLISYARWGGVALGIAQAFLTIDPRPVFGLLGVLAASLVMATYNLPAAFAGRLAPRTVERVVLGALVGDFLVCTAWVMLTGNDIYSTSYAVFGLVAIEAAVLFGWPGTLTFVGAFVGAFAMFYVYRWRAFGFAPMVGSVVYRGGLIIITASFIGAITSQTTRWRRAVVASEADLKDEVARSRALYLLSSTIAEKLTTDHVFETMMDSLARVFPDRWHGILLATPGGTLELADVRGEPRELSFEIPADSALADIARSVVFADFWNDPIASSVVKPESLRGYRSAVALLLRGATDFYGLLLSLDPGLDAFREDEVHFLETVAYQATTALENAGLYERVEQLSITDATTGLLNRRAFNTRVEEELARARRFKTPLAVVMFDLDHFKRYNDTHGHLAGDEVLGRIGVLLKAHVVREYDLAFRYGGEEFAVLAPVARGDEALTVARRVVDCVREEFCAEPDLDRRVTVSAGVAVFPEDGSMANELVQHADEALYRAKDWGRDRVVMYAGAGREAGARVAVHPPRQA
ncbi:MAG: GGDEF domain-containing protein [Candidatus Dormibacteria bacterium]